MSAALNFAGKVKGVNLTTKPGAPSLGAMWGSGWDWDGWMRPQIDCAVALGANAIRIIGDVLCVINGTLSQASYNARWQQVAAYCAANNLALYYTGCSLTGTDGSSNGTAALTDAQIAGVINNNFAALSAHTGIILGVDIVQEANNGLNAQRVAAIYAAVRPNVPTVIPCTFSTFAPVSDLSWINSIVGSCDFLDLHIYPFVYDINAQPAPSTFAPLIAAYPTKDLLFGEGGLDTASYTEAQEIAWTQGLVALGDMAGSRGALLWAAQDQNEQYGAFDSLWFPRRSVAGPWIKWCRLSYLTAPPPPPPPPPPPGESPSGTLVPPASQITDSSQAVWTLGAITQYGKQVLRNGVSADGGQATLLSYNNGQLKAQNSTGSWWLWGGSHWSATSAP
jgi:hypothetical protein